MNLSDKELNIAFGVKLKQIRKEKGFTQRQLAFESELNINYIGYLEKGKYSPSLTIVNKIANTLEVKLKDLVDF